MSGPKHEVMHFAVHPSVLFKLGEDLITDDAQALAELIKNSYDADARVVRVQIDTHTWFDRETGESLTTGDTAPANTNAVRGRISVSDDGAGMTNSAIERGWLTVSYSEKRELKRMGQTTRLDRTPLGDKGLGRLGAQRLGSVLQLQTTPVTKVDADGKHFGSATSELIIDWDRFLTADTLELVSLEVSTTDSSPRPAGTVVSVLGLADTDYWTQRGQQSLQRELTTILSPYESANGVHVFVTVNGDQVDLRQQARAVLDAAPFRIRFRYCEGRVEIETETSIAVLAGRRQEDRQAYKRLIEPDRGAGFGEWLVTERQSRAQEIGAYLGDDRYFLKTQHVIALGDVAPTGTSVEDPGEFSGEISALNFEDPDESAFGSRSELRAFAKSLQGIRVFRDGFGIRLAEDWLGLSGQQTSATSFYGLRPGNTTGYVNLTARENAALEETSSREAFRDTAAWRGFFALMTGVADYARRTQEFIRRNWNSYKNQFEIAPDIEEMATPHEIAEHIEHQIAAATNVSNRMRDIQATEDALSTVIENVSTAAQANESSVWRDDHVSKALSEITPQLESVQSRLRNASLDLDELTRAQDQLRQAAVLLSAKIEVAEERIAMAWESVALGLSAELLAHEVESISDRLRGHSTLLLNYEKERSKPDRRVIAFAEHVRASAAELARQVSRLNPALRYRRERKTRRWVGALLAEAADYFNERWRDEGITFIVDVIEDFEVDVNQGKFSQVIDNLALNSRYWVLRDVKTGRATDGHVRFVVDAPVVRVSDTGPGISATVDDSLFDAFVTTKPAGEGRGLGLFVVSQLLGSEGAEIHLTDHRNGAGRRDTFEIDLAALATGSRRGGKNG